MAGPKHATSPTGQPPKDDAPAQPEAKRLAANVAVGNQWYGPDYPGNEVTLEVAAQITNPAAWV